MKKYMKSIISKAGVLLIAAVLLVSILPAVTADTDATTGTAFSELTLSYGGEAYQPENKPIPVRLTGEKLPYEGSQGTFSGGAPSLDPVIWDNGPADGFAHASQIDVTYPLNAQCADDFWFNDPMVVTDVHWIAGWWNGPPNYVNPVDYYIFFYADDGGVPTGSGLSDPEVTALATYFFPSLLGTMIGTDTFSYEATLSPGFVCDPGVKYWIALVPAFAFPPQSGLVSTSSVTGAYGKQGAPAIGMPFWTGPTTPTDFNFILTGIPHVPGGECIEDACDFELVSLNQAYMYEGKINELPQIINITVTNNGEIGINELKLLADVYKKVCGDTTTLYCDEKYDLRYWETETADVFAIEDDGDGDSWVLQGGAEGRWLTNNQAWRCTLGKYRSAGGDEDKYLGLCDTCVGYDNLTFSPVDPAANEISGAACATLEFSHWCEGEYTFDDDGYVVPVDYGFISYRIDDGSGTVPWTMVNLTDFVAYDTDGEWETVKMVFLNTDIFAGTTYAAVCDDCDPDEDDIVVEADFPDDAFLEIRFSWVKDPCYQFEGWYIDNLCITRTEMYELELVHQTHVIMELPPCDPETGPIYKFVEFPIGWDPEPDTWYEIKICGQVFSPNDCEIDTENNCIELQFYVTDIHDLICKDMEILTAPPYRPGDSITVNMTIQNIGTFAEDNVPVELRVADCIIDSAIAEEFETDPSGRWSCYYFTGFTPGCFWDWTEGDPSISRIFEIDEASARSVLPGDESFLCGHHGSEITWPYLTEGIGALITDDVVYDFYGDGAMGATLKFYTKWSLEIEQYYDSWYGTWNIVPGSEGAQAALVVHPTSGPDSAFWWLIDFGAWYHNGVYHNDWIQIEADMLALQESFAYDGTVPAVEFGWALLTWVEDGDCGNPTNPLPWSGWLLDRIELDVIGCQGTGTVVAETTTGALAPGEEEVITMTWSDAEYCRHCLITDVNLDGDVDTSNDFCHDCVLVDNVTDIGDFSSMDLTGGGDCLWHLCETRGGGDDQYAWAGIEEPTWAHYVNDMDDSFVSPPINASAGADPGVSGCGLKYVTWYEFADAADKGEVFIRGSSADPWEKIGGVSGSSGGYFEDKLHFIPPEFCTENFQVKFRMVSDDDLVSEGWYIDDVEIWTAILPAGSFQPGTVLYEHTPYDGGSAATSTYDPTYPIDYECADYFDGVTEPIGQVNWIAFAATYPWANADPTPGMIFNVRFYDETAPSEPVWGSPVYEELGIPLTSAEMDYVGAFWGGSYDCWSFEIPLASAVEMEEGYVAVQNVYPSPAMCWMLSINSLDDDLAAWQKNSGSLTYDMSFQLIEGAPTTFTLVDLLWSDDFERDNIAPWQCIKTTAGDFWRHYTSSSGYLPSGVTADYNGDDDWWVIHGYPNQGKGLNDVLYTAIDLTDELLTYAELTFAMAWNIEGGCVQYIEISDDFDGANMADATWAPYWSNLGADSSGGWVHSTDLVNDNRFVLNQYLGQEITLRFRYTTPGEGLFAIAAGHGWAVDGLSLIIKGTTFVDEEAPVTSIFFNPDTAQVTLIAEDYPINKGCGVKATYYSIDGGAQQTYTGAFSIGEGTHTVAYHSEDNCGNVEATKTATYTVDTTAPTVELTSPEEGKLYFLGNPIMDRILGTGTLCIGKVPCAANANDGTGSGVAMVLFSFDNGDSGFDDDGSNGYTYTWRGMHFGALTVTAVAIDNVGLTSSPDSMSITVYSLGLL
jgi:hypothetical protein